MSEKNDYPLLREEVNKDRVKLLGKYISNVYPDFQEKKFTQDIIKGLKDLGLNERISLITDNLHKYLPDCYPKALKILMESQEPALPDDINDVKGDVLGTTLGFVNCSYTLFVSRYGLDHTDISLKALKEMTKRFSAEWAIRDFLIKDERKTLKELEKWSSDSSLHVRRLVSEGTRPRIPWGIQLKQYIADPSPVIDLLTNLKEDPCLYVRRSVANNLNDISKDHPTLVTKTLKSWNKTKTKEMKWLTSHALRTLIKKGDTKALALIGFSENVKINTNKLKLKKKRIVLGESLSFAFNIDSTSKKDQDLLIDYIVYHKKRMAL